MIKSQISLGAGGEGQEKEAGRGGAGGDHIKICINFAYFLIIHLYTYPIYIKLACMIRMITLILPLCCLFNLERHELARGIYIIREVYIAMFVIRIIQLTIAFNHSYHTCKFDIDWISILLK